MFGINLSLVDSLFAESPAYSAGLFIAASH
jgi:hypothetical protein